MGHGRPQRVEVKGRFALRAVTAVAVLWAAAPTLAHAQASAGQAPPIAKLSGLVVDRMTMVPVIGARVYLVGSAGLAPLSVAQSDSLGGFALPPAPSGAYELRVERIGYQQIAEGVILAAGDDQDVTIYLVPDAIDLEPVVVMVSRTEAYYMRGFEERRAMGSGTFITRDQIERRHSTQTSEMLHSMAGVRVAYGRQGEVSLFVRGTCRPQVYIDGIATQQGTSIDMAVLPDHIEGVEIYSSASIPPQYASMSACAAILVWTRPAVRGEGKKASVWKLLFAGATLLTMLIIAR